MPLQVLVAWWNLIFIVPFGLALFYLGLFVFTGITFGDADADMDADADVDANADVDADADATVHVEAHVGDMETDADADADMDADADADADHEASSSSLVHVGADPAEGIHDHPVEGHGSAFGNILSFLGVGKIPLSLALMTLMFCWGITGFALNALLFKWLGGTAVISLISLPVTLVIALALTGLFAALIARIIPNEEGPRERRTDLVGKAGEAIYDINTDFGMATVRGAAGDFFQVPCRTAPGKPLIPKGARIVLFDYDREKGIFQVAPFEA